MTIFQKIAASSFAAVSATLRRRLLSLTIHEAIVCDQKLDVDSRERALTDARALLHDMFSLSTDTLGRAQVERLLADARVKLLRKLGEKVETQSDDDDSHATSAEESVATLVSVALPAERQRIQDLLRRIPDGNESKTQELLRALFSKTIARLIDQITWKNRNLWTVCLRRNSFEFPITNGDMLGNASN